MLELETNNNDENPIESRLILRRRGQTEWPRHGLRESGQEAYLDQLP